jgi:single-strand DNA-binding protein
MFNKVIMVGNLTRDIELKYLPTGSAIAKSAIATSYKYKSTTGEQKDEVCFLDFNIFGRSAEIANQYLKKGSKVLLEGRLVFEQWTDSNGGTRSKHSLRVDTMKMLGDNSNTNIQIESNKEYEKPVQIKESKLYEPKNIQIDIDEDEIPF